MKRPLVPELMARLSAGIGWTGALVALGVLASSVQAADGQVVAVNQEAIVVSLPIFFGCMSGAIFGTWQVAAWYALRKNREDDLEAEIQDLRQALERQGVVFPPKQRGTRK